MGRHFPGLSGKVTYKQRRPGGALRICVASPDIVGMTRNGGIGSTYGDLALTLAAASHEVTILYLAPACEAGVNGESVVDSYKKQGVQLLRLPRKGPPIRATDPACISYMAYRWLKERDFDVIHFPEWTGLGYYSLVAKRLGLAFLDSTIVIGLHGPTAYLYFSGSVESADTLEREFMERKSVAYADVVFSPTQYMISWVADQGWELPKRACVQPHILRDRFIQGGNQQAVKIEELVFFGRLQERKGLFLFCDALDLIAKNSKLTPVPVTFLGKQVMLDWRSSGEYIRERSRLWPFPVRILSDFGRDEALAYLKEGGRLALIPSLIENFGRTVHECCAMGIPFLASAVGGIPESIAPEDQARVCFVPRARNLAERLVSALEKGVAPTPPAHDFEANRKAWTNWYEPPEKDESIPDVKENGTGDKPLSYPLVSVCLPTFNRPRLLAQALESLRSQDYPNFEVLLVDDGSDEPEALAFLDRLGPEFKTRGWRIIRQENRYGGAARNNGARHARGEYLLFMDDDNYAEPHEISTFVRAAVYSGADILTCALKNFTGSARPSSHLHAPESVFLPLGAAADVGTVRNCFGDTNALVRRSTFEQLGGFDEDYGVGAVDYEFFARAVLRGARLDVVPEELAWYRVQPGSVGRTTPGDANADRALRPYLEALGPDLRGIIRLFRGYHYAGIDQVLATRQQSLHQFETLWNSWSWRSLRPVRNFIRRCRRLPPERKPRIDSIYDVQQAIRSIKRSATWQVTRPLRALRKLMKRWLTS